MRYVVWIVSGVLAVAFLFIGGMKVLSPWEALESASMGIPVILLKIAGVAEILGAFGLILPAATRIAPILTPIAASGLVVTMVGASIANVIVGTLPIVAQTVTLGLLSAFVAWARFTGRGGRPVPRQAVTENA